MSGGVPMDEREAEAVRRVIEHACACTFGADFVERVRQTHREVQEAWSHMTDAQIADWIMGKEE